MSTATLKVDRLYEMRGTLHLMASPFVWTARTYALGARNLVHGTRRLIGREPRVVAKVAVRPGRNYGPSLKLATALFPREWVRVLRSIGYENSDPFIVRLRTIPLAVAGGHSFNAIWDDLCDDERLSEREIETLSIEAVSELEQSMKTEGLL